MCSPYVGSHLQMIQMLQGEHTKNACIHLEIQAITNYCHTFHHYVIIDYTLKLCFVLKLDSS